MSRHECLENTVIYLHKASTPFWKRKTLNIITITCKFFNDDEKQISHITQFANIVLPQNINHCSEGLKLYLVICVQRGSA